MTPPGREQIAKDILVCTDCGHYACKRCAGRPEHSYVPDTSAEKRIRPRDFRNNLKSAIPMSVTFKGFERADLEALAGKGDTAKRWSVAVSGVSGAEFRFHSLQRSEVWTATYLSSIGSSQEDKKDGGAVSKREATLELIIDPTSGPSTSSFFSRSHIKESLICPMNIYLILFCSFQQLPPSWSQTLEKLF